jgi:hypothetical protein
MCRPAARRASTRFRRFDSRRWRAIGERAEERAGRLDLGLPINAHASLRPCRAAVGFTYTYRQSRPMT